MAIDLEELRTQTNIAEQLEESDLDVLGRTLIEAVDEDDRSRATWLHAQGEYIKLASQVAESKNTPWPDAANIKYPLLTLAAIHFHARALPGLLNSERPVLAKVTGKSKPEKISRSMRVSTYMSYDLQAISSNWMDVMDRLLLVLPMTGVAYKKTFWSEIKGKQVSELVLPSELIINYHAVDFDKARKTHIRYMDGNEVVEHVRRGLFLDVDLREMTQGESLVGERDTVIGLHPTEDKLEEHYKFYEIHARLDLDDDGYTEPYIITVDYDSRKVVRIVARWKEDAIEYNEDGEVMYVDPEEYFTRYQLVPDPNSAVYGLGFGTLLGTTNEAINTLVNQLIDAGTLSNMQSGFLGRGNKLRGGALRFKPGEWKQVNMSGDDLRKSIFPMPIREPSGTLFSLLQFLLDAGQQVTSVSDMMMGENPGQNQKATTTMAVLEQGLSVFKGIYRRIHRSLTTELIRACDLNYRFLDEERYMNVLDEQLPEAVATSNGPLPQSSAEGSIEDFNLDDLNVMPTADPSIIVDAQKLAKSQSLMEKVQMGLPLNPQIALIQMLEAEGHEDIPELLNVPDKGPSIEEKELELEILKTRIEALKAFTQGIKNIAEAEAAEEGSQLSQYQAIVSDLATTIGLENEAKERAASSGTPTTGTGTSTGGTN